MMTTLEVAHELACLCLHGVIDDINRAGLDLLGAEEYRQLRGQRFIRYVGPDYRAVVDDLLSLRYSEPQSVPVQLVRLDGAARDVELRVMPARELGAGYALVMARDISHESHLARSARASENRFRSLVENSMHMIAHCRGDRIIYINRAGADMLGAYDVCALNGWPVAELFAGEYRELFAADLDALLDEPAVLPVRLARFDGSTVDAQLRVTPLPGVRAGEREFMLEARDVSAQIRAVAALRQVNDTLEDKVHERTRQLDDQRRVAEHGHQAALETRRFVEGLLEAVPTPLWWKDRHGRFLGYNRAFREVNGLAGDEWVGKTLEEVGIAEPYARSSNEADWAALLGTRRVRFESNLAFADGRRHDVVVTKTAYRDAEDRVAGVIGALLDISEHKRLEAELRRLATIDALSGVANRRHFMEVAALEFERARRYDRPLALLMLDIDHFKRINDGYGHPAGDEAIRALARTCGEVVRAEDGVGRLGGEEFAIVLPETALEEAMAVAERLRVAIAALRIPTCGQGEIAFTTSIGVAVLAADDAGIETLLSRADLALYRAKNTGRDRVVAG